jgi:hypothetical protein
MNSQTLFDLFNLQTSEYIRKYVWNTPNNEVGFGIVKSYPKSKQFTPAKKLNGEDDNAILLKAFLYRLVDAQEGKYFVGTSVSKISLYQIEKDIHFQQDFDYNDPKCPTKESVTLSLKGQQPISLEEMDRFELDITTNSFYDLKKKKAVEAKDVINHIYNEHLASYTSIRGRKLKAKVWLNNTLIKITQKTGEPLIKIIPSISGRKIKNDFHNLFYQPFGWETTQGTKENKVGELIEYEDLLRKINPITFSFVTTFIVGLYILYTFLHCDLLHIVGFIKANKDDQVFVVVLVAFCVLFFNYILPNILLYILNSLIRLNRKLSFRKFQL